MEFVAEGGVGHEINWVGWWLMVRCPYGATA